MSKEKITLQFWGVRGSIPTPGPQTIRYGGNTPCVALHFPNDEIFLLDAGTGIRQFGYYYENNRVNKSLHIFISHYHWDHIQGLPFFKVLRMPEYEITIYGSEEPDNHISTIISRQMESTYFPIQLQDLSAQIHFYSLTEGNYVIGDIQVESFFVNHPGYALGYKFLYENKKIVYISDNEPFQEKRSVEIHTLNEKKIPKKNFGNSRLIEEIFDSYEENKNELLLKKISGVDVLIHDAQYFPAEYKTHQLWGHSPFTFPIDLAKRGNIKKLILFHHDPNHDDEILDRLYLEAQEYARSVSYYGEILMAREMDIHFI